MKAKYFPLIRAVVLNLFIVYTIIYTIFSITITFLILFYYLFLLKIIEVTLISKIK